MPFKTSDITLDRDNGLYAFVGPADCGKTYASTSFGLASKSFGGSDPREALVIECDGRITALRNRPVVFEPFTNEQGAVGVLDYIKELREDAVRYKKCKYHTIIFSSATAFGDFAVADSLEGTEKGKGKTHAELKMLTMQDYGFEAEAFRQLLWENFTDLKRYCRVIVEFHEVPEYTNEPVTPGSKITVARWDGFSYKLLMHGNKIASRLSTRFDEMYHFKAKESLPSTGGLRRSVCFQDNVGRTSFEGLKKFGSRSVDISRKEFYPWWLENRNS